MKGTSRLFDCVNLNFEKHPDKVLLAGKEGGKYREYSPREVKDIVDKLACGLMKLGIGPGDGTPEGKDKVAIIAHNRPEWIFIDLAIQKVGAVLAPIYPTIGEPELEYILQDSAVKTIFINDDSFLEKLEPIKKNLPLLQTFYSIDPSEKIPDWKQLLEGTTEEDHAKVEALSAQITGESLATIIYTSGTTGRPKGVMLTHNNIYSNVRDSMDCFPPGENLRSLSFLPLNHSFERMVMYLYLFKGVSVYFAESLETIVDNLKEVKPQIFTTVPRLLEKVYEKIMQKGAELTGIKKSMFFWAHGLAKKFEINKNMGWWYNFQLNLANKLIFKKWREALGGEVLCIVSGGAACSVKLIKIFTAARIVIMEGYGLTETSPVISVNRYNEKDRMFGTVGPLIDNVEVKIAEDGEIYCKGPNVMAGYYKMPEETAEVMDGEWFKTGDIGEIVDGRFLKITDRKKEIFKTSGGKYVAPGAVENRMKESIYIENIMVVGAGMKFTSALIVPSEENLKKWAANNGLSGISKSELLKNEKVLALFQSEVDRLNVGLGHVEQVKKFALVPTEWSVDSEEMTPKLSLRRKIILNKYHDLIESIYAE
ncbi:MAG: long-chain fatty acid--CoA ligase [Chitinophagaceae bacterium]|nr:long-chain fatty acid--CoA ligase [Chitinophagaceae bacterium]